MSQVENYNRYHLEYDYQKL